MDPEFARNNWVYVYYAPPLRRPAATRRPPAGRARSRRSTATTSSSRFRWNPTSGRSTWPPSRAHQGRPEPWHVLPRGGDVAWDAAGNLYLATGDDTSPLESDGYSPIDERADPQPGLRRPARRGQHQRPARQDPADQAGPGDGTYTDPGRQPVRRQRRRTRGRRSSRWAPQPLPDGRRPGDRLRVRGRLRPRRRRPERHPRTAAATSSATCCGARQLRLAVLHRRQRRVQRVQVRDRHSRARCSTAPRRSTTRPTTPAGQNLPASTLPDIWYGNGGPWEADCRPAARSRRWPGRSTTTTRRTRRRPSSPPTTTTTGSPRVGARLDPETAIDAGGGPLRSAPSSTIPPSGGRTRWTWSSGLTARSTCSTTAAASSAARQLRALPRRLRAGRPPAGHRGGRRPDVDEREHLRVQF